MAQGSPRVNYQLDITKDIQPSTASPSSGMQAEASKGAVLQGLVGIAGTIYEHKKAYDINQGEEEARRLRNEFLTSGMEAEAAAKDIAVNTDRERALMERNRTLSTINNDPYTPQDELDAAGNEAKVNLAALEGFRAQAQRLKAASESGMSSEEYATRVAMITKATIAKYPGLGDRIRQEMGRITGLAGADEFAAYQYVQERFSRKTNDPNKGLPSAEDIIKDTAAKGGFLLNDVYKAYTTNKAEFANMERIARGNERVRMQQTVVEQSTKGETIVSDTDARSRIPMLQAYAGTHGLEAFLNLQKQVTPEKLQKLLDSTNDVGEKQSVLKQYAEQGKWFLGQKKRSSYQLIDNMMATSGGRISKDVLAEMRAAVDDQYKAIEDEFLNPGGQLAVLGVMAQHRDKTLEQQVKLASANSAFIAAWGNNTLVQGWLAGGKMRQNVAKEYPELDSLLSTYEKNAFDLSKNTNALIGNGQLLSVLSSSAAQAEASPEANTTRSKPGDVAVGAQALSWLQQWKKNNAPISTEGYNAISTMLAHSTDGATYQLIGRNYNDLQKVMNEAPADVKSNVAVAVDRSYTTNINRIKATWAAANKEGLQLEVVPGTIAVGVVGQPGVSLGVGARSLPGNLVQNEFVSKQIVPYVMASARARSVVTGESLPAAFTDIVKQLNGPAPVSSFLVKKTEESTPMSASDRTAGDIKALEQEIARMTKRPSWISEEAHAQQMSILTSELARLKGSK